MRLSEFCEGKRLLLVVCPGMEGSEVYSSLPSDLACTRKDIPREVLGERDAIDKVTQLIEQELKTGEYDDFLVLTGCALLLSELLRRQWYSLIIGERNEVFRLDHPTLYSSLPYVIDKGGRETVRTFSGIGHFKTIRATTKNYKGERNH